VRCSGLLPSRYLRRRRRAPASANAPRPNSSMEAGSGTTAEKTILYIGEVKTHTNDAGCQRRAPGIEEGSLGVVCAGSARSHQRGRTCHP